jgi:hypothetical protein
MLRNTFTFLQLLAICYFLWINVNTNFSLYLLFLYFLRSNRTFLFIQLLNVCRYIKWLWNIVCSKNTMLRNTFTFLQLLAICYFLWINVNTNFSLYLLFLYILRFNRIFLFIQLLNVCRYIKWLWNIVYSKNTMLRNTFTFWQLLAFCYFLWINVNTKFKRRWFTQICDILFLFRKI